MKTLLSSFILLCFVISAPAAEITSIDDDKLNLTSISSDNSSFRPLKYCKNGNCELIPNEKTLLLQAFSEQDLDWTNIFNQCKNYQSLNQLYTWTQIISSLVVTLKPISVLRNLRSTKNILAGWGLFGRIVGKRIVFDSGITIAGQLVYSVPTQIIDKGNPYPELSPEDVELASNLIEEVISENQDVYYLPEELIEGIAVILKGCTSQLKQEYIYNDVQNCMGHCHTSQKNRSLKTTREAPHFPSSLVPSLKIDLEKQKIKDYLQDPN